MLAAFDVAKSDTVSRTINALGFCVGGSLLACALAVLGAGRDRSVESATFLTTMLDFADPGEIGVYLSPEFIAARKPALESGQRMHGAELASAFSSLRANELVWSYVVRNYLKGQTPPAFDLLYWNGDSANLPGPMFAYYLSEFYMGNRLAEPGALTMAGERIDLAKLTMPIYVYASRDDHIVPWKSAWRTTALAGSADVTFVLGAWATSPGWCERRVAAVKAAESGKPAEIVARMVEGSVAKFLKEVRLLDQPFVKNDKQSVGQTLKAAGTTVRGFTLYFVGEGIEKRQDDFAAEVAAQVAAAKG